MTVQVEKWQWNWDHASSANKYWDIDKMVCYNKTLWLVTDMKYVNHWSQLYTHIVTLFRYRWILSSHLQCCLSNSLLPYSFPTRIFFSFSNMFPSCMLHVWPKTTDGKIGGKKGLILKLTCHKVDFPTYVQHYLQAMSCWAWTCTETWPRQTRHLSKILPTDTQEPLLVSGSRVSASWSDSTCNDEAARSCNASSTVNSRVRIRCGLLSDTHFFWNMSSGSVSRSDMSIPFPFSLTSGCLRTSSQPTWEKKKPRLASWGSASVSLNLWCTLWSRAHSCTWFCKIKILFHIIPP